MSGVRQRAGAEKEGSPRQRGREGNVNEATSKESPEVRIVLVLRSCGRGCMVWSVSGCAGYWTDLIGLGMFHWGSVRSRLVGVRG